MRTTSLIPAATPKRGAVLPLAALGVFLVILRLITDLIPADFIPWELRDAGTLALSIFIESFPFVVLGALVSTAVQLWIPQHLLLRFLPKNPILRRSMLSLLGVLLPVCECGNVPLARGLLKRGLTPAEALTFVFAAPLLNPVTIITTYQAFGFADGILFWRIIAGFTIANLIGWIFSKTSQPHTLLTANFNTDLAAQSHNPITSSQHTNCKDRKTNTNTSNILNKIRIAARMFTAEMTLLLPALALGSVFAGVVQALTPTQILQTLGTHPVYSVFALLALAAIISICSTVDAFFMLGFAGTFMPGGVIAFLVFGALFDIKMLLLLRTTFNLRTLLITATIAFFACLTLGLGVNFFA